MRKSKKILIDCSSLQIGGGIQVALSFLNDLLYIAEKDNFHVLLSPQMAGKIEVENFPNNFTFTILEKSIYRNILLRVRFLRRIEDQINPDIIFAVFGPSYYKSKRKKIVGYAIPHYIYKDSPYFDTINLKEKIRLFLIRNLQVFLFKKNSDILVFETKDAQQRFCSGYKYPVERSYVVHNTLNQIFLTDNKLYKKKFKFNSKNSILCLSSNYKHKNIQIVPRVIDFLIQDFKLTEFKFIISGESVDFNFSKKYDQYIEFIGYVPLDCLVPLYESIDILFMPSLLEVFSATYLEAMYMNVPIVTTDLSFSRDVCDNAALYYQPLNPKDAARKLSWIINSFKLREELVRNGKQNLKRFGDSEKRTRSYLHIINETL